jgi:ABC-type multidrug transport system fused ATPase/permease subunit
VTRGKVEYRDVDFRYDEDGKQVLRDVSFTIEPGTKLALVGESGGGKTTISNLLMSLYEPNSGQVCIDGQDLATRSRGSVRAQVATVFQDAALFSGTIRENIAYANPDASMEEIEEAARSANAEGFIKKFPNGYDTEIGERGIKLSGGQRQRLSIARALLKNAPILILDEATSSLDSESERLIQDALRTLMQGKTVIVIAHRLSTIMTMDRIVVVDSGRVTEMGTHSDLLQQKNGLYQRLWDIQAGGFLPDTQTAAP